MAAPIRTKVTVDGVDVTPFLLEWDMQNTTQAMIKDINILFHSQVTTLQPLMPDDMVGLELIVKRGPVTGEEEFVFRGFIIGSEKEGNKIILLGRDKLYQCVQRNVTKTFANNIDTEAGKLSEIFKTLINDFGGLTADNSSVIDSGTDIILERFFCNNADVYERCELLAEFLSWQFYYRPNVDKVFFEPQGFQTSVGTITVGDEISERPKWIRDGSKKVKTLKVFGGPQEVETTEFFSGDTVETDFVLSLIPVSVKVFISGVLQVGEVEGTVVDADYAVDPGTKTIIFTDPPASGASNIEIRFSYLSPIAVTGQNSIDYGLDLTIRKEELTTLSDVQNFTVTYLLRHSVDFISALLKVTNVEGMDPGQTITCVDVEQNINGVFLIQKVKMKFPYQKDEIEVDSEDVRTEEWQITTEDRIRRIEERLAQQESLVFILRNLTRDTVEWQRRYFKLTRRNISGPASFYDNLAAIYGTSTYQSTVPIPFVNAVIQQGKDVYTEKFHDTDFEDTGTATWDTSGKQLVFA